MRLESIKVKDLQTFLESEDFKKMRYIPISRRRGFAQAINPRALPEDVALLLAYLDEKMVGYLGFLPDDIYNDQQTTHLAWMSCIWVDPNTRGKGVAKSLLKKGMEVWDNKLLATEFTAPAKKLYDKLGLFDDLHINHGLRCYLRFNLATLLPTSRPKLKILKPLLKISDFILNGLNDFRLFFSSKKLPIDFQVESFKKLDAECDRFIELKNSSEFFKRDKKDLQWILDNPWVGGEENDKQDSERYHFSIYTSDFQFTVLKIKENDKVKALLILSEREGAIKIPYCWLEKGCEQIVVKVIWRHMLKRRVNTLTIYQQELISYFKSTRTPFYLKRPFSRHYLISKNIDKKDLPNQMVIQDGDGDGAFT